MISRSLDAVEKLENICKKFKNFFNIWWQPRNKLSIKLVQFPPNPDWVKLWRIKKITNEIFKSSSFEMRNESESTEDFNWVSQLQNKGMQCATKQLHAYLLWYLYQVHYLVYLLTTTQPGVIVNWLFNGGSVHPLPPDHWPLLFY